MSSRPLFRFHRLRTVRLARQAVELFYNRGMMRTALRFTACLILIATLSPATAQESTPSTIIPSDYLVLPAVGQYGRLPLHRDAIEAEYVAGNWRPPEAGDTIDALDGGQEIWQAVAARDGVLNTRSQRGGYAFTTFEAPADSVMLLEASGHAAAYVNGEPHAGDPYDLGWLRLPVRVKQGPNTLLFHLASNKLSVRLTTPSDDVFFADDDRTLPTVVREEPNPAWAALPIINTTDDILNNIEIVCKAASGESRSTPLVRIPPLSVRKAPFEVPVVKEPNGRETRYEVILTHGDDNRPLARTEVVLKFVDATDINIRTFRSRIDGSVQPYAIRPAENSSQLELDTPGVILTLHDAGVSCEEYITRYAPKSWAHVIAPQGRRPHGFDWEAWSRIDFLEAFADAEKHYPCDPLRTCLTGRGMGGHGVWHLGVTYPDMFAAIGPSGGWISFWSYGGGMAEFAQKPSAIEAMLLRGYAPSDTTELVTNLAGVGVYVLHDSAEVHVPVEQARFFRERLAEFHANFVYQEPTTAELAAHNSSDDWPRMVEFFEHSQRTTSRDQTMIDFTTADPGISACCDWVTIDAQAEQLIASHVTMHHDRDANAFVGSTQNVSRLAIDTKQLAAGQMANVTLDDQQLQGLRRPTDDEKLWFERHDGKWSATGPPAATVKRAVRNGTFNAVIDHNVLLVYGTKGNDEENRWAQAKARFDAETFYYRGNATLEVMPDSQFSVQDHADRSIILYGNAETNSAWATLLPDCPVDVKRGTVRVGDRTESGDDLAVLMVRPRPDSDTALVGVVGGTGPAGMRLASRLRWFVSGIVYPDLMILDPKVLTEGTSHIRAWGYFGPDWKTDDAEIAWRQ